MLMLKAIGFVAQGSGGFLEHNVPLWFVSCLFVVEMAYWFISNLKDWAIVAVSVGCAILGYFLVYQCDFWDFKLMPWSMEVSLMAMVFFAAGHLSVKKLSYIGIMEIVNKRKWLSVVLMLLGLALTAIAGHYNGAPSMGHSRLGNNPLVFYVTAFVGIVSMLLLCILISGLFAQENRLSLGVKWFGRNSFNAMAIHNPIRAFIMVIVARLFRTTDVVISETTSLSLLSFVVTLIVTCIGMWVIEYGNKHFRRSRVSK